MPYSLSFDRPAWLLLLGLLPVLWVMARGSLAGLGWRRMVGALVLRSLVLAAIVMALAEARWDRRSESVAVAYVLDQSDSIPADHRAAMLRFVEASVDRHLQQQEGDLAAVVVFGREAAVEAPPLDRSVLGSRVESPIDATASNLSDALRTAAASLPSGSARRIVVVTDGNETLGSAAADARALADAGISIDVVPAPVGARSDVLVESIATPGAAATDQPYEVRVVLNHRTQGTGTAAGVLRISRQAGGTETTIAESRVELPPGKSVFRFAQNLGARDFYTYEARFTPDRPADDRFTANNTAAGFVDVSGRGRVLLIEDVGHEGEFATLATRLRGEGLEVDVRPSDQAFTSLAELQRYDSVLLANVARTNDSDASGYTSLSDGQVAMLVQNTKELGCGLIMLGGQRSFGAGGWSGTPLEEAMPVDFQIKNAKVIPEGALALVIDRSGSMAGEKFVLSLAAARAAIATLGPRDFVTVVAFDDSASLISPIARKENGAKASARVARLSIGGGTNLYPGMQMGFDQIRKAPASVKHMIVLTDGQTPPDRYADLAAQMRAENITVSGVAVGPDADRQLLSQIALAGGGKFYAVNSPRAVPRIFMNEARRVSMPVVRLLTPPRTPVRVANHPLLSGIEGDLPPVSGFVQTTLKQSALVDVLLRSPVPANEQNATLLATWTYGVGKAAALTTDAGHDWANAWTGWEGYDRFFAQLVRWSMRPTGVGANYVVSTSTEGEQTRVVIDAIDDQDQTIDGLGMIGYAVGPDLKSLPVTIEQTAPGRYLGQLQTDQPGSYFLTIVPTGGGAPIRTGLSVGYSREYDSVGVNLPLLETMAGLAPTGGPPGKIAVAEEALPFDTPEGDQAAAELNPFRHDLPAAIASRDVWPLLVVLAGVVFTADVFIRRVQIDLSWAFTGLASLLGRLPKPAPAGPTPRLQSRSAESTSWEGPLSTTTTPPRVPTPRSTPRPGTTAASAAPAPPQEASYMDRLKAAKQTARPRPNDK